MDNLFNGQLVKLTAPDIENDSKLMEVWHRDTEFFRLAYGRMAEPWSAKAIKDRLERHGGDPSGTLFSIRTLADNKLIGQMGMYLEQPHGDGYVWILIGERDYWGKGYGSDAMRVMLRYGFTELNMHRVSLRTFGFNARAIRSYEKVGFVHEGKCRDALNRMGQRWDEIWMGITKQEWEKTNS